MNFVEVLQTPCKTLLYVLHVQERLETAGCYCEYTN
jgi:hypothetical protein